MAAYLLPQKKNAFIDRRKSVSSAMMTGGNKRKDSLQPKENVSAARRMSTPQLSLSDALFGQALYNISDTVKDLCVGLPINPLPPPRPRSKAVPHAPRKVLKLTEEEERETVMEALRYFPTKTHETLEPEFTEELRKYGHIYMYRFRPSLKMKAYPLCHYPVVTYQAAAAMQMIMGMLDPKSAKYPHELVTYNGRGQVFANWAQFWIVMHYLSTMTEEQTLVIYSGHPTGLFPSFPTSPRVVVTNGITQLPRSPSCPDGDIFSTGVSMFGNIGPQAVVHATMITMISAYRKLEKSDDLTGKVFVSSGLGEMGCAQALASIMNGCVGVIAEVNGDAIEKWIKEDWITESTSDLDVLITKIRKGKEERKGKCIAFHGNVVDVWERLVEELEETGDRLVDMGTDQTNLHNAFSGGYIPAQLDPEEAESMIATKPAKFKKCVLKCLRYHISAINKLVEAGMIFWEYGNGLQYHAKEAGADMMKPEDDATYRYLNYGKDILGDFLTVGFAPFRWTFTSGSPNDIAAMDKEVVQILDGIAKSNVEELPPITPVDIHDYYKDSIKWMTEVQKHKWNYGTLSRMLYTDERGRKAIALHFNKAIKNDVIKGPVVLSRDYHDTSVIGNALKEPVDIKQKDKFQSDIAIQDYMGDSFRGATWISVTNSFRSGLGQVIDGGFGLVIDGSEEAERKAKVALAWDAVNAVARRSWSGNPHARATIKRSMKDNHSVQVTVPHIKSDDMKSYARAFGGINKT